VPASPDERACPRDLRAARRGGAREGVARRLPAGFARHARRPVVADEAVDAEDGDALHAGFRCGRNEAAVNPAFYRSGGVSAERAELRRERQRPATIFGRRRARAVRAVRRRGRGVL